MTETIFPFLRTTEGEWGGRGRGEGVVTGTSDGI